MGLKHIAKLFVRRITHSYSSRSQIPISQLSPPTKWQRSLTLFSLTYGSSFPDFLSRYTGEFTHNLPSRFTEGFTFNLFSNEVGRFTDHLPTHEVGGD